MNEVKGVLFCLFYLDYRELEWVLPLLHSYKNRKVHVSVLLPVRAKSPRQKLMTEWVDTYCDEILYGCDVVYERGTWISKFCSIVEQKNSHNFIVELFFNNILYPGSRIAKLTGLSKLHRWVAKKTMNKLLGGTDIVYTYGPSFRNQNLNSIAGIVYSAIKKMGKPSVGYPIGVYKEQKEVVKKYKCVDLNLVVSESDKKACEKNGMPSVLIGAQRFKTSWIDEISKYFSRHKDVIRLQKSFPDIPIALVFLKNRTGLGKNKIDTEMRQESRRKLFLTLIENGFYVLIKPHPGEDISILSSHLESIPSKMYCVSEIPAQYLIELSVCSVLELPSNCVLDSIALKKKAYWPYRMMHQVDRDIDDNKLVNSLISAGFPYKFFQLVDLKVPEVDYEHSVNNDVLDNFDLIVNTHINIDHSIKKCEKIVLNLQGEQNE